MNKTMISILSLIVIFNLCFAQSDHKIIGLRGIENSAGNSHLFYRLNNSFDLDYQNIIHSSIYHLDVKNNVDTVFLQFCCSPNPYYDYILYYEDYDFWNNDPNKYISCGVETGLDPTYFIKRYDAGEYFNGSYIADGAIKIFILNQEDSLVYANVGGRMIFSSDSGKTWPSDLGSAPEFNLLSINKFDENIFLGCNNSGNLLRSDDRGESYIIVDDKEKWSEDSKFYYDKDKKHIYAVTRKSESSALIISDNKGNPYTWDLIYSDINRICLTADDSASGEVYFSKGRKIYKSIDYGASVSLFKEFEKRISGLYKKPDTNILYASVPYEIYEITPDTIISIKEIKPYNKLKFYPLSTGDKWIYFDSGSIEGDHYERYWTKEVTGDTVMPNGQLYKIIKKVKLDYNRINYYYERIDSLSGKVFGYNQDDSSSSYESLLEDLFAVIDDTIQGSHYHYEGGIYTCFMEEDSIEVLDKIRLSRQYKSEGLDRHIYDLAEDIGLYKDSYSFDFGSGISILQGAVVNGNIIGDTTIVGIHEDKFKPVKFQLRQNYPNPFNGRTIISYHLPQKSKIELKIYDMLGMEVRGLVKGGQAAGRQSVIWNGKDNNGNTVSSGVYIYRLKTDYTTKGRKMLFLK